MTSNNGASLGFIGLGTMGEPMCRNLAAKAGRPVLAYDLRSEPGERLAARGVASTSSIAAIAAAETIFLSLPGRDEVRAVCLGPGGLLDHARRGQSVVDLSTTPAGFAREIAAACAAIGVAFADAPVARTRAAAESGTLSIMVGADQATFDRIAPLLAFKNVEAGMSKIKRVPVPGKRTVRGKQPTKPQRMTKGNIPFSAVSGFPQSLRIHLQMADRYYRRGKLPVTITTAAI